MSALINLIGWAGALVLLFLIYSELKATTDEADRIMKKIP